MSNLLGNLRGGHKLTRLELGATLEKNAPVGFIPVKAS
jgi:hypothetical protein